MVLLAWDIFMEPRIMKAEASEAMIFMLMGIGLFMLGTIAIGAVVEYKEHIDNNHTQPQEVMICNFMDRESYLIYNYTVRESTVVDEDRGMVFTISNCGGYR